MTHTEGAFLAILRDALHETPPADPGLAPGEWQGLFQLAEAHKLLPPILDAAWSLPSCRAALRPAGRPDPKPPPPASVGRPDPRPPSPVGADAPIGPPAPPAPAGRPDPRPPSPPPVGADAHIGPSASPVQSLPLEGKVSPQATDEVVPRQTANVPGSSDWQSHALQQLTSQALRENDFLNLILGLRARGLEPVLLKGAVCRALWPKPLLRSSEDEDLLIPPGSGPAYHAAMLELGMTPYEPEGDLNRSTELCYYKRDSSLFVELNSCFFDPDSEILRPFNEALAGAADRAVPIRIQDVSLQTLASTDHLLFLILHAFKHFLYGGFGLRVAADVCLYARQYAEEIDFARVLGACAENRCDCFTAAILRIGERHLGLPVPEAFALPAVDETALLADILDAGLHGEDIDRIHSANYTLGAVENRNSGRSVSGLRRALFPERSSLTPRYPWLEKRPWLLPAAWALRAGSYLKNRGKYGHENPVASMRLGKERVELLRAYGVIDRK